MMVCCDSQITAEQHPKEREQEKSNTPFSTGRFLAHFRPCDDTLENSSCQIFE